MVAWHHWLNGLEFEQAPGDGEGQGSLRAAVHGVTEGGTWLWLDNHNPPKQSCAFSNIVSWALKTITRPKSSNLILNKCKIWTSRRTLEFPTGLVGGDHLTTTLFQSPYSWIPQASRLLWAQQTLQASSCLCVLLWPLWSAFLPSLSDSLCSQGTPAPLLKPRSCACHRLSWVSFACFHFILSRLTQDLTHLSSPPRSFLTPSIH